MIDEVFTADIDVRLRSGEANYLLRLFRARRNAGEPVTIALLDAAIMKNYGANLVLLEKSGSQDYRFLYAGAQIPADEAGAMLGRTTREVESGIAGFYRLGCHEAEIINDAVAIYHLSGPRAPVHRWECLFLPMEDGQGHRVFVALCAPREHKDAFLRLILDLAPHAALFAMPVRGESNDIIDARIIYANRQTAEMAGAAKADALIGSSLIELFGEKRTSGNWDRSLASLRSGKTQSFEFHLRSETSSRWFEVVLHPARDGIAVFLDDISEKKRAFLEVEHQKKILIEEMEQRRGLEQELWALAHLDSLTALPNRRAFRDAARLKLAEAQTTHRPCALISLDIDHFKRVNDAHGHAAGDAVLRRVADIIRAPLRPSADIAARMGGEEFSLILADTDVDSAIAFAEKLRKRIEQTVVVVGEHEIRPTISLGIAMNRHSSDLDDLLDRADRALYSAKRTGRNRVVAEIEGIGAANEPSAAA